MMAENELEKTLDDILCRDDSQLLVTQLDDFAGVVKDGWFVCLLATIREAIAIGYAEGVEAGRVQAMADIRRSHLSEN